jgi:trigger factor
MSNDESKAESIQVETSEVSPAIRSLTIEVEAKLVNKAFKRSYSELSKKAQVKGFRPGKVPLSIVKKMYASNVAEEIERQLVSETLFDAVQKADVLPLCEPDIDAETPEEGSPFRYTAHIEVRPTIELPKLSEVVGKRVAVSVSDEDVEGELEQLQERQARMVEEAEDAVAANGHTLSIDFVGRVDGVAFEGGTGQDMEIELGSGRLVEGFEDQLIGKQAGDDVEVTVTFPDDYNSEDLQGKQAVFQVHVAAVKRREVPELDDEFAKDIGDHDTIEELRNKLREDILERRLQGSEEGLKQSVMESLVELTDFEVPPGVVERQLHSQMSSMQRRFQDQVPEEFLREQLSRMHEDGRPAAERRVREGFLLAQIVDEQSIEVEDSDVVERIDEMAEERGVESEQMRKMAEEQGWHDALRTELLDGRALDHLVAQASVEEVEALDESDADADANSESDSNSDSNSDSETKAQNEESDAE